MSRQKDRLQNQAPGIFSPSIVRNLEGTTNPASLKSRQDLESEGISDANYYTYDLPGEGIKSSAQIPLDFSKFENHTFFNSAQANVNVAFNNVINNYPFDGTRKELEEYLSKLTGFENYVLGKFPTNLGFLVFSGATERATGGLLAADGNYIEVKDFSGANFLDFSKNKTGDSVLNFGQHSFSAEGHFYLPGESNGNEVIYQKLSGANGGFTLALSESSSTTDVEFVCGVSSGSVSLVASASLVKERFNHVCAVYDRGFSDGKLRIYVNQKLEGTSDKSAQFGDIDFSLSPMFIGSGSIHSEILDDGLSFTPNRTFSGSIDEVRIFHKARTIDDLRQSSQRGIFGSGDLKLYFKFNEPSASIGNNSIVLDSSGNSLHSIVSNYSVFNRQTGSLPPSMESESRSFNPVLFPQYEEVISLNEGLLVSASDYDEKNPNLITKLIPQHYLEEGKEFFAFETDEGEIVQEYSGSSMPGSGQLGSAQIMSAMLYMWGKHFDEIKAATDQFSQLTNPSYDDTEGTADAFLPFLARQYGFELPPILTDANPAQFYHGENLQNEYTNIALPLQKIRNALLKRMLVNIQDIIASKGTVHSIKTLFRSLGLDPDILVRIKEYGGPKKFALSDNRAKRAAILPRLTFSGALAGVDTASGDGLGFDNNVPHLVSTYLSSSRDEVGYPPAQGSFVKSAARGFHGQSDNVDDGLQTSGSWTAEILTRFPGITTGSYQMSQSIMRLHVTGTRAPTNKQGVVANLITFSGSDNTSRLKLYVRAAASEHETAFKPALTLALTGVNVMDGDYWTIGFGRYRHDDPSLDTPSEISSSYFLRCGKQVGGKVSQLYQTSAFYLEDPFHRAFPTGAISYDVFQNISTLNESGSFVAVGSQSLDDGANIFLNGMTIDQVGADIAREARTTFFQGDISFVRFWSKALNLPEWTEHVRNPYSTGVEDPLVNFDFETARSGSFQKLRLDLSVDQAVTGSDSSGAIHLIDLSQNATSASIGSGFEPNKELKRYEKIFFSSFSPAWDEMESETKVRPRSFVSSSNRDEYNAARAPLYKLPVDDMPQDDSRFSIDFSVANALNEDIINIFSTLDELDNAVGSPELMYALEYPELSNMRDVYFNKLTDKVNFKNFLEYFRWFDKSVGAVVEQLIPKKTKFLGVNFVIEPHNLERSKLQYHTYDMYLGLDMRKNLKGTLLLQQIVGRLKKF